VSGAARDRILVALDTDRATDARSLVAALGGRVGGFKIGLELFSACGPDLVREIRDRGHDVFVDLKLHDIPSTVAGASAALARLGATLLTVHATGGLEMLRAAVRGATRGAEEVCARRPAVLAVTVLTSLDDAALERIGLAGPCASAVDRLVALAEEAGADGVVCSPLEIGIARKRLPTGLIVVPGIRPAGGLSDDQARIATPRAAVARGADRLVIGRPITRAADPCAAAAAIAAEID